MSDEREVNDWFAEYEYIAITGTPDYIAATATKYMRARRLVTSPDGQPVLIGMGCSPLTGEHSILVLVMKAR
jgi:hypothetical protein